jgi:hypothetical protein
VSARTLTTGTTRRGFLRRAALAAAAWLGAPLLGAGCDGTASAPPRGTRDALEAYFGAEGLEAATRAGRAGLATSADPEALRREALELAAKASPEAGPEDAAAVWGERVAGELARLEVASLANWQLAPTELRLCALAALVAGG